MHLHWLVRSAIIVLAVAIIGDGSFVLMQAAWDWLRSQLLPYGLSWLTGHIVLMGWIGGMVAFALGADAWLRRHGRPEPLDVPRCRCGYPLVGLSEARCPECGAKADA